MEYHDIDYESWKPAHFTNYVARKLQDIGIQYKLNIPADYMVLGRLMRNFRNADKTKYALKMEIDKIFETKIFTCVNSLTFLWALIKQTPKPKKEKRRKIDVLFFSDELRKKLRDLKEEIS